MSWPPRLALLFRITGTRGIARRYLVVNGFDGALTMLGILVGFYVSQPTEMQVVLSACGGAALALGMSGLSSAYVSERAERRLELNRLEDAMVADLNETAHGRAARWVPLFIAMVNGFAPLLVSMIIMSPLVLAWLGALEYLPSMRGAIALALLTVFLLGVFLGRIGRTFWLISGLQALIIALCTLGLIVLLGG